MTLTGEHSVMDRVAHSADALRWAHLARALFNAARTAEPGEQRRVLDVASAAAEECDRRMGWARAIREEMTP